MDGQAFSPRPLLGDTGPMSEITIREMEQDEEFSAWFSDLLSEEDEAEGTTSRVEDRYLVLTSEIGDWVGGLRYTLQGGVAHLVEVAVAPAERRLGHAHRLLGAFEERASGYGAHLVEFWTDDLRSEAFLVAMGWQRVMAREGYIGGHTWYLMEKAIPSS
jgi:GNAT superfamily N-acetyltransferase